jgi:hypothetical protein
MKESPMPDDAQAAAASTLHRQDGLIGAYCHVPCPAWLVPERDFAAMLDAVLAKLPLANER